MHSINCSIPTTLNPRDSTSPFLSISVFYIPYILVQGEYPIVLEVIEQSLTERDSCDSNIALCKVNRIIESIDFPSILF